MATGDDLIDDDGNDKMDADGNDMVDDGAGNECDCGCGEPFDCVSCVLPGRVCCYSTNGSATYDKATVEAALLWTSSNAILAAAESVWLAMSDTMAYSHQGASADTIGGGSNIYYSSLSGTFVVSGTTYRVKQHLGMFCNFGVHTSEIQIYIQRFNGATWDNIAPSIAQVARNPEPRPCYNWDFERITDYTSGSFTPPIVETPVSVSIVSKCCRCTNSCAKTSDGSNAEENGSGAGPCTAAQDDNCPP